MPRRSNPAAHKARIRENRSWEETQAMSTAQPPRCELVDFPPTLWLCGAQRHPDVTRMRPWSLRANSRPSSKIFSTSAKPQPQRHVNSDREKCSERSPIVFIPHKPKRKRAAPCGDGSRGREGVPRCAPGRDGVVISFFKNKLRFYNASYFFFAPSTRLPVRLQPYRPETRAGTGFCPSY